MVQSCQYHRDSTTWNKDSQRRNIGTKEIKERMKKSRLVSGLNTKT